MWNVCGWSRDPAQTLRSKIVQSLNLDIIGLCETFLVKDQDISVDGYKWFGKLSREGLVGDQVGWVS